MYPVEKGEKGCFFNPNLGKSPWPPALWGAGTELSSCPSLEATHHWGGLGQEGEL